MLKAWQRGITHFRAREFEAALEAFKAAAAHEAIQAEGADNPSRLYIQRCQELLQNPPPKGWNGVYVKTNK
jgi:adenylate cyclase